MNTLSYFLSTLRPSPPPSPRASTSELPIPLEEPASSSSSSSGLLVTVTPNRPRLVEQDSTDTTGDVLDTDGEGSSRDGEQRGRTGRQRDDELDLGDDLIETVFVNDQRGEPPRIGIVPPSRKGSRKGKSRARDESRFESLDGETTNEKVNLDNRDEGLPFHDKQTTTAPMLSQTVALSTTTTDRGQSWPFVARLARTWPFRFTASLYLLIRRFFSLFGLAYPTRPHLNSLLSRLQTEPDPEKSATSIVSIKSTVVSLSLSQDTTGSTPPTSLPPSPTPFSQSMIPRQIRAPPPRMTPKTLVLDLDETLIHSTSRPSSLGGRGRRAVPKGLKTTMVEVVLDGRSTMYTVYKRPWVDFFLRKVSSWYTVIIFTASLPEYADPVIDWLDGGDGRGGLIRGRLFRSHCLAKNGTYMKDLTVVDPDLAKVCLVDNSPVSYAINQSNGIPIEGWINDPNDECLLDLLPMLDSLRFTNDVRRVLGLRGFGKTSTGTTPTGPTTRRGSTNLSMTSTVPGGTRPAGSGDGRRRVPSAS